MKLSRLNLIAHAAALFAACGLAEFSFAVADRPATGALTKLSAAVAMVGIDAALGIVLAVCFLLFVALCRFLCAPRAIPDTPNALTEFAHRLAVPAAAGSSAVLILLCLATGAHSIKVSEFTFALYAALVLIPLALAYPFAKSLAFFAAEDPACVTSTPRLLRQWMKALLACPLFPLLAWRVRRGSSRPWRAAAVAAGWFALLCALALGVYVQYDYYRFSRAVQDFHRPNAVVVFLLLLCLAAVLPAPRRWRRFYPALLALLALCIAHAFVFYPAHGEARFLAMHYSEQTRTASLLLRKLGDWDNDGHANLLGDSDAAPLNAAISPYSCRFDTSPAPQALRRGAPALPVPEPHPGRNLLLIAVDSLRKDRLQRYGGDEHIAPFLNRFSVQCVIFDHAVTPAPFTLMAVSAALTGRYRSLNEPLDYPTLAAMLKQRGYATYNLGFNVRQIKPGFDYNPTRESFEHNLLDDALRCLRNNGEGAPFLMYLHPLEPHYPYFAPARLRLFGDTPEGHYNAAVRNIDEQLERFFHEFEQLPCARNTTVVLFADHGEEFNEHGYYFHGYNLYDTVVNVPLMIKDPALAPARVGALVSLGDLCPTLLSWCGVATAHTFHFEPILPAPALQEPPRQCFTQARYTHKVAVVEAGWKLIWDISLAYEELYDLRNDPGETVNRIHAEPDTARRLRAALRGWLSDGRTSYARFDYLIEPGVTLRAGTLDKIGALLKKPPLALPLFVCLFLLLLGVSSAAAWRWAVAILVIAAAIFYTGRFYHLYRQDPSQRLHKEIILKAAELNAFHPASAPAVVPLGGEFVAYAATVEFLNMEFSDDNASAVVRFTVRYRYGIGPDEARARDALRSQSAGVEDIIALPATAHGDGRWTLDIATVELSPIALLSPK